MMTFKRTVTYIKKRTQNFHEAEVSRTFNFIII